MWWGGLRGSVGLALALQIYHTLYSEKMWGDGGVSDDPENIGFGKYEMRLDCRDLPMDFLLMTVFVVFMTVVVNGMTMAPLMRALKMTEQSDDRKFMLNATGNKLAHGTDEYIAKLQSQKVFASVNWHYVESKKCANGVDFFTDHTVNDPMKAAWLQVIAIERASYVAQFERGRLGSEAFLKLEAFMATLLAHANQTAGSELSAMYDAEFEIFLKGLLRSTRRGALQDACEVAMAYIRGQQSVQHSTQVGIEGGPYNTWYNRVKREHQDNVDQMILTLQTIEAQYPHIVREFKDSHAAGLVLHHQRDMVEQMQHHGELNDLDATTMLDLINRRLKQLYFQPVSVSVSAIIGSVREPSARIEPEESSIRGGAASGAGVMGEDPSLARGATSSHSWRSPLQLVTLARGSRSRARCRGTTSSQTSRGRLYPTFRQNT